MANKTDETKVFDRCSICNLWTSSITYIEDKPYCSKHANQKVYDKEGVELSKQRDKNADILQSAISITPEYPNNDDVD